MHISDERLSAYLDGELFGPARAEVERHLADCRECSRALMDAERILQKTQTAPPMIPHHFLEELLAYPQALVPLPTWAWNLVLYVLTFGTIALAPTAQIGWRGPNWPATILPILAETLIGTYLFYGLTYLRRTIRALAKADHDVAALREFTADYVAPIYGWHNWTFGPIHLQVSSWQTTAIVTCIGFTNWSITTVHGFSLPSILSLLYIMPVKGSLWLAGLFYLRFLIGLFGLLRKLAPLPRNAASEALRKRIRNLVQVTTVVASICITAWLIGVRMQDWPLNFWGPVLSLFLLLAVFGHLYFERRFFSAAGRPRLPARSPIEFPRTVAAAASACLPVAVSLLGR